MPDSSRALDPRKFRDPHTTADGQQRAVVALTHLTTLWFNTGSLCNITCVNCYMDSSPKNDALAYITLDEIQGYLDEIDREEMRVEEIAFTGGEPFMNPDIIPMIGEALGRGYRVLVLTNAMKPLLNKREKLLPLKETYGDALSVRVSVDHYTRKGHEEIRGKDTWPPMIEGLRWLAANGFNLAVAGRTCWDEDEKIGRAGYAGLFADEDIPIDADNMTRLVLFPEMDAEVDVPEITVHCWDILGIKPETMMCASSRMVVKRKGADAPTVVPCTLLPYDETFELGSALSESSKAVQLNHPHCAKFCVLGGASCSPD
ncbi:MAG: radical SAM protein [Rhodospirillales bacterium]|nr:radical SAM protein [Rhodospirillales bacterium]MBO6787980.1 radical SAM protein [Rhodospirillales bacterium]